jgi:CDP-glucose 4,6-dehydratase
MNKIKDIYKGKKVLITGHTGFKGSWLSMWLTKLGADVIGISDAIPTNPSNFSASNIKKNTKDYRLNIMELDNLISILKEHSPDFVFHLAAQALVYEAYKNPLETLKVNAIGSTNILEAIRLLDKPIIGIMITSDKAYDNLEWVWGYRETDPIGGIDPYSASKGMAELAIKTYVKSYFQNPKDGVRIGIARAGNVIGGGDWAKNRIVPDCMKSWSVNKTVDIRKPNATRPWQHVLEPLSGYLLLGAELYNRPSKHGEAYNFGPPANQNYPVKDLIDEMSSSWKRVRWQDTSSNSKNLHEAGLLKLNCDKALNDLGWLPTLEFGKTVKMTVDWYKTFYESKKHNMWEFGSNQIDEYTSIAEKKKRIWATY